MRHEDINELSCWSALNRIFGFSPRAGHALIRHFGSADRIFSAGKEDLGAVLGRGSQYLDRLISTHISEEKRELEELKSMGSLLIPFDDERYPESLRECEDAPIALYVKGESSPENIFSERPAVAIVGTRDITGYGKEWCIKIVSTLSRCGIQPLIVSGLAIGTDITAQSAALDNGLPTLSVMATGIDEIYPFRHGWIADRICHSEGSGLITDYPPGTVPKAVNFLRRNRIIAGMSKAVILIESKKKGGGLLTCQLAWSYNRDVYALPGRIDDICSQGCNDIIRERTGEAITDPEMLADALGLHPEKSRTPDLRKTVFSKYTGSEGQEIAEKMADIACIIKNNRGLRIEDLYPLTGIEYAEAAGMVEKMICDGIIVTDILHGCAINPKIM